MTITRQPLDDRTGLPIITGKPRVKSAGEAIDEMNNTPIFTPADIGYARPLGSVVFVQPKQAAKRTPGGLHLPDEAQPVPSEGVVVAAGPGDTTYSGTFVPNTVKVGDRVKFPQQMFANGIRLTGTDGVERMVIPMREPDITCVFDAPPAE